jgi:hypothetical protein
MVERKYNHNTNCNNRNNLSYNYYKYQFIREHGGWDNWDMILVENFPCNNSEEARQREYYWITELHATLNKLSPIAVTKRGVNSKKRMENPEYRAYHNNIIKASMAKRTAALRAANTAAANTAAAELPTAVSS